MTLNVPQTPQELVATKVIRLGVSPSDSNKKIGQIRTHIYNYVFGKTAAGPRSKIIFRIDDTNKDKQDKNKAKEIFQFFVDELRCEFDITPNNSHKEIGQSVFQSERQHYYKYYLQILLDMGMAVIDPETNQILFDIHKFITKFGQTIEIHDVLFGNLKFNLEEHLKRGQFYFPLTRADTSALYHLASVVDDGVFGVTHLVRAQNKISIAEYQEMIRCALSFTTVRYLHVPMLLDEDGSVLSKGPIKYADFIKAGICPKAIFSYILSSGYGDPEKLYTSLDEIAENFDPKSIHKKNGKFDPKRLASINRKFQKAATSDEFLDNLYHFLHERNCDLAEKLYADSTLQALIISFKRPVSESASLLQTIFAPQYDNVSQELAIYIDIVICNSEKSGNLTLTPDGLKTHNKLFYDAWRWIIVGKQSFPGIEGVFNYLNQKNLLRTRIAFAKQQLALTNY